MGGPCPILDPRYLQPQAILWSRSFHVRDGSYTAVAYIQNPNPDAGVSSAHYQFRLYDSENILVAEREGSSFIMPGSVTPVLESRINTGNRIVAHTYFAFIDSLVWQRMRNSALDMTIQNKDIADIDTLPRVNAEVTNTSITDMINPSFVVTIYDPSGNAFAASQTVLSRLAAGSTAHIVFTWPDPFGMSVGRVEIMPVSAPVTLE